MREFLQIIDTSGGHIIICLLMGLLGIYLLIHGHEMAAEPLIAMFGVVTYAMTGRNSIKKTP